MDRPRTRYARSGELAIAYQVHGSGDRDLLFNSGVASNLETVWGIPEAAPLFERFGGFARVIRFDRRDTGLSDPIRDDLTLEAHAEDALAVIDAAGSEQPVLMGSLDGARSLALLAATRPQRVGGLIAISPWAKGLATTTEFVIESLEQTLAELTDYPNADLLRIWAPDWVDDPIRMDRLRRYMQTSATPRQAGRILRMQLITDIRDVPPLVQAPTLVLHPPALQMLPVASVREFAELIPGARYREVSGNSANSFALDIEEIAGIIEEFVTGTRPPRQPSGSWPLSCSPTWSTRPGMQRAAGTELGRACSTAISGARGRPSRPSAGRRSRPPAMVFSPSSPGRGRAFAVRNR